MVVANSRCAGRVRGQDRVGAPDPVSTRTRPPSFTATANRGDSVCCGCITGPLEKFRCRSHRPTRRTATQDPRRQPDTPCTRNACSVTNPLTYPTRTLAVCHARMEPATRPRGRSLHRLATRGVPGKEIEGQRPSGNLGPVGRVPVEAQPGATGFGEQQPLHAGEVPNVHR